jgi:hypothetical protein
VHDGGKNCDNKKDPNNFLETFQGNLSTLQYLSYVTVPPSSMQVASFLSYNYRHNHVHHDHTTGNNYQSNMPPKGMNPKAAAASDKKAAAQAQKDAKAAADREREVQAEWAKGANNRSAAKSDEAAAKADEVERKKREKAALLAAEEETLMSGGKAKNKTPTLSKGKGNNKKNNDLSLLENALVSGAEKKVKAKKQAEREKVEKLQAEQAKKKEQEDAVQIDPLLANTEQMIVGTVDDLVGRAANKALDEEYATASGIDGALQSLNLSGGGATLPTTNMKVLYKSFEDRTMVELKDDYPGLKLSQYKDKVFQLWKKSPDNPANQL